jgi:hypothetical protein
VQLQVGVRVLQRVQPVLDGHHRADLRRCTGAVHVAAHEGSERTAGADREAFARAQRELGIALGLLLISHRENPLVTAGLDMVSRDDAGGAADRARGVNAEHRLAGCAEGVR